MAQAQNTGLSVPFAEKAHIGRLKKEQQDFHSHLSFHPRAALQAVRRCIFLR